MIAEIRGEIPDDEDKTDIYFVIDNPKVPPTEIEIEKVIEAVGELSMFCENGETFPNFNVEAQKTENHRGLF